MTEFLSSSQVGHDCVITTTTRSYLWPSCHTWSYLWPSYNIWSHLWRLGHSCDLVSPEIHQKCISSQSFDNLLTIPLPNSCSLQCAKSSAYLKSLMHLVKILDFFFSRLGHACDLVLNYMTKMPGYGLVAYLRPLGHRRRFPHCLTKSNIFTFVETDETTTS